LTGPQENYDPETGLLSAVGMDHAIDAELSRAARHEIPLALVYLEVSSPRRNEGASADRHLLARVAEALLGSVRAEDRVGRIGEFRFAVLATEGGNGEKLARRLGEHVRRHLGKSNGGETAIIVAAVDCQFDEMTHEQLVAQVEQELAAALLAASRSSITRPSSDGRSKLV
jgi:GGDEF domain-containing protein